MRAFITGAGGCIGSAIKELYLHHGYEVVAPRSAELDLSDMDAIHRWFDSHRSEFDVIIHCAGYNRPQSAVDTSLNDFMKTQYVNYISLLEIVKSNDAYFREHGGYIVGIGSLYATITREGRAAYTCSKHALVGLIKTLALEYGPYNVLCNTVSPGFVNTKMFKQNNSEAKRAELAAKTAINRLAEPEDIARVVYFLGNPENTFLSGQDIIVDGAFMAGSYQSIRR